MEKRPFGKTGLMVSALTFGAWSIGGPAEMGGKQVGWSGVNDDDSIDALKAALDGGINLFDTADVYGRGHSEELIGRAFAGAARDKVLISSKAGMVDNADGFKLDFSRQHLIETCEGSLRRLQTDHLDIYLLHLTIDGYPLTDDIRHTLEILKAAGKIRHFGVSVQFAHQGVEQLEKRFGDSMMIEYSPLKRGAVEDVIRRAGEAGVGVITRGALEKGLLSGKYRPGHRFAADDVRSRIPTDYIDRVLARVEQIKGTTNLLAAALQFQQKQPGVSTITVGMKTRRQVIDKIAALNETETLHDNPLDHLVAV